MNKTTLSLAGILALLLTSCATTKTYTIESKSNSEVQGTAMFTQKGNTVELDMNVLKLNPNGVHAAHIHENGDCSAPDGSSAGGHWNPTSHDHGKWGMGEHHTGDLGNLKANAQGTSRLVMKTDKWCLGCSDPSKNLYGKSIIIHAQADDFKTQPTGNAGGRVGCVVIK
ncbi:superoxide dismutase family protein [Marnyiella aurantia]|uniref:Superoxide dismutase [Cu-Zn] n=1 Tax=Marnyiella aurantia TaxID=2758037 RepID=A0A7D7QX41_9FLAO|nr:superoxide dismutase family protein [Marnyiella aurantia]MBA5247124.1 superoxide dismutase family protein [Marnyiella aurantia]QMS97546.1 superoxide dismutase family protein [Marnyiella aurantia]